MSGRWADLGCGGDSSQDFTQATQEESALDLDEYTQVEPSGENEAEDKQDPNRPSEPVPWGRLMRLSGGGAVPLMPRAEQPQGRALNEVTLGRGKMCEVQVHDQRISSKHCRIYCEAVSSHLGGMEVYVEDMSANGTWINQEMKLVRGQRRLLHSGDEISLLNPYRNKKAVVGSGWGGAGRGARESRRPEDDQDKLEAEAATFTFINLNRNKGASHGRSGSLSVAETLRAGTVHGVSSPVLRSSASGVAGIFGGARKVEDFYDVREMIGHGTSGEVRRAINRTTGKQVAVKVIETRKFALTPGLTPKELVQEAEMLKRVHHEYIIKLEDIFQTDQAVYLVMDLVSGGDLFDRIVEKGVYAEDLAQELLFRVLTAVDYLHSQDIVHRDLKPENILLVGRDDDVDVKITDFGLAKRANKEGLKTFCGTPQYFAPEVLKRRNTVLGVGRYGKEADMWSVGVILYILLSGTHPFHTTTLFDQITHASYSMTGEEWEHISDAAKDLVSKLLTENPGSRLTATQALAHPFITERPTAPASSAAAAGLSVARSVSPASHLTTLKPASAGGESAPSDKGAAETSAAGAGAGAKTGGTSSPPVDGRDTAEATQHVKKAADKTAGGGAALTVTSVRTPSQDTDPSSASGAEDIPPASRESLSPTEGGGGSAKVVPPSRQEVDSKGIDLPKEARKPTPAKDFPAELPPPQPREALKGAARGSGDGESVEGGAGARGRKRAKKDGAADKQKPPPPPPYTQLHVVRVGGPDQSVEGDALCEESHGLGTAGAGAGAGAASLYDKSNGFHRGAVAKGTGTAGSGNGRGEAGQMGSQAREHARPNGRASGTLSSQGARGRRTAPPVSGGARAAPQCSAGAGGVDAVRPSSSRHNPRRAAAPAAAAAASASSSSPADDEIMDYSSDDSPAKSKRARLCRGRQQEVATSSSLASSKPTTATGRRRANAAAPTVPSSSPATASLSACAVSKRSVKSNAPAPLPPSSQQHQQHQQQRGGGGGGGKQMHLNFSDGGKLNLSKLAPPSRGGAGSAASGPGAGDGAGDGAAVGGGRERDRTSGDQAAQAAAGGAAASLEYAVGGGAPAGSGGGASAGAGTAGVAEGAKAGKSSGDRKQQGKAGSKPQRTMTHLWKRAGRGQA